MAEQQRMTKDQLTDHIKSTVVPLIKDTVGSDVAKLVRENVEQAIAGAKSETPNYARKMFDGEPQKSSANVNDKALSFGAYVRALAGAKNDKEKAIKFARMWGYADVADALEKSVDKAMSAGDPTGGGFLVPPEFSRDVIELLRPSGTVRSLQPMMMPMPTGSVKVPRITDGANAAYVGENSNISKTEVELGQLTLSWKKLAAIVPISNDLIRYSSPAADQVVRDDLVRAVVQREDKAFIRDNGTGSVPKGIKYWVNSANKFNANGTVNLANVTTDLGKAIRLIMDADINLVVNQAGTGAITVRPGWIFAPRTWQYLFTVQTGLGTHAFRDEMLRGTLFGWPFRVTTQIPITASSSTSDTGGNYSELYFGAFAHAVIGESERLMVDASQEAAYYDGSNVQAAFSLDQTVIRVIEEHDFALRHDKAFSMIEQVTYGA